MQLMNDDMDELFRRAADNYPLNTNTADWNEVQKKLLAATTVAPPATKKYNKSLWLLLLLLPAAWIAFESISNHTNNGSTPILVHRTGETKQKTPQSTNAVSHNAQVSRPSQLRSLEAYNTSTPVKQKQTVIHPSMELVSVTEATAETVGQNPNSPTWFISGIDPVIMTSLESNLNLLRGGMPVMRINNQITTKTEENSQGQLSTPQNRKVSTFAKHSLYAGLMASPDISTVKSQRVNNLGSGIGLVAGYEFNKHFSLESGLLFDKKYYYSRGEYVNTKRIALPGYSSVKSVKGVCKMIELPIDLKYNFKHKGRSNISASAGLSSYFMQKEVYDYTLAYSGWDEQRRSIYKKSSSDLLAVINLSAGYNKNLGRDTKLFISPYLKIPVKGVGIGSLPIMSTGVNVGITKKLVTF